MLSAIYKRAVGALEVFNAVLLSAIYKRAVGALAVFNADPPATIYKCHSSTPEAATDSSQRE
ncbi:hypothetical protein J7656_11835 [Halorubrum ruber]|uniref:Uncharacterized protein n=1 Tax=Halorubrum ruber TaxID=2982524 RepID=A0A8T8LQQ9_9EURY|nr:hypothetical protein J7656_11835 [Halorubrum ruber]